MCKGHQIKRLSVYMSLSHYIHLYIWIFEYSLNDVTFIWLRFYAVFHSPSCGAGLLGVLESYDLHEHVQHTIPECKSENGNRYWIFPTMEPQLLKHYI